MTPPPVTPDLLASIYDLAMTQDAVYFVKDRHSLKLLAYTEEPRHMQYFRIDHSMPRRQAIEQIRKALEF